MKSSTDQHQPTADEHQPTADELAHSLEQALPDAAGPVHVLGASATATGATDYEVSAHRLVPVDPDDPDLAEVFVAVPVTGHLRLAPDGTASAELAEVDELAAHEARAWARSLIVSGAVAGVTAAGPTYGPPQRATHELVEDASGRRVLRRIGFNLF